jgi:hypothetical protein
MLAKSPVEHGGKHADRPIVTFTGGVRQATEVPGSTHLQNWTLRGVWQSKPQTSMEPIDWRYLPYIFGLWFGNIPTKYMALYGTVPPF